MNDILKIARHEDFTERLLNVDAPEEVIELLQKLLQ